MSARTSTPEAPRIAFACDFHLKYASRLLGALGRAGCRVALVTRDHGEEFGDDPAAMREEIDAWLAGTDAAVHLLPGRVSDAHALRAVHEVRGHVGRFRPDVVHLQERVNNDPRLLVAARPRPRRYALTVHDPIRHPGDEPRGRVFAAGDSALIRGSGLLFVHAEQLRSELIAQERPRAPVSVVPHGADPAVVKPLPDRPTMLFFGRLSYYKGLDVLLDALPAVWERVPEARLVVAGDGDRPEHPALADPRVEARFGHVPEGDVAGLFADATCAVLPYRQASQSGVGSRAKSYGRATVVSRLGGLPELVADGSGVAVEPENPAALAGALVDLLTDPEQAAAMGRRGAEALETGASWDRVARLTLDAYRAAGLLRA